MLVVEDEAAIRAGVVTALADEGCLVEGRADGSTLAADLEGFRPDLVVLDVMLPGRDGLELAGDVRGRRVLDAGCGSGPLAAALRDRGATVAGFDSSAVMIELARARLGPDVELRVADLDQPLPYADAAFDAP